MPKRLLASRALVAMIVIGVAAPPIRVSAEALALVPSVMAAPVRPLEWLTDAPRHELVAYLGPKAEQRADVWVPAGASPRNRVGAVVLAFGVNQKGRTHPAVLRVASALARTGVTVMVPDSALLRTGRLDSSEIDGLVHAFERLADRPEVDPSKVGMFGFSAGGSLALLAASDARIAGRVRYVNALGVFGDARTYLASLAAHAYDDNGRVVEWHPAELAIQGYPQLVFQEVPNAQDRQLLTAAYEKTLLAGALPAGDTALASRLGWQGSCIYRLIIAGNLRNASEAVENLPDTTRELLDELSPARHLDGLRAPVYLMHGVDDDTVPVVESRRLAEALRARGLLARYDEFRLFKHVQSADLDPLTAAPELWKLVWHLQAVLMQTA